MSGPPTNIVADHRRIQSEYAAVAPLAASATAIKQTADSLPNVRKSPLDLDEQRLAIQKAVNTNFLLLQIVLGILLACMLVYAILPFEYSQPIVFLLLCVGVAVGIFLKK
jgi:hypothetical protein